MSGVCCGGGAGAGGRFEPSQHFTARVCSLGQSASGFENTFSAWRAHVLPTDSRYPNGCFNPVLPLLPHIWHWFVVPASTGTSSSSGVSILFL